MAPPNSTSIVSLRVSDGAFNMRKHVRVAVCAALVAGVTPSEAIGGQGGAATSGAASRPTTVPTAEQPPGSATQSPATGLLHHEELTGDWGGVRTRWKDKGVVFDSSLTQFYQGVASGGTAVPLLRQPAMELQGHHGGCEIKSGVRCDVAGTRS
jgi:hypothetical protein